MAKHGNVAWRCDTQANSLSKDIHHGYRDVVADQHGFADPPRQNEHGCGPRLKL
jgi:hypothetical protein